MPGVLASPFRVAANVELELITRLPVSVRIPVVLDDPADEPGFRVELTVVIPATVPVPPRVDPVLTVTSPAVPLTSSVPASTLAARVPSVPSRPRVPWPCLISPLLAVTTPVSSSVAPELSTIVVPAPG